MKEKKPADQEFLDATSAPLQERWPPGKESPAIGADEGLLRTLAKSDDGARRAVQLADAWNGPEVPGNKLEEFFCGLISGKTIKNLDSELKERKGKLPVGNRKTAFEKWPLAAWFYTRYFCETEHRGKDIMQIAQEEKLI